jgi:hypothetical protein
MIPNRLKAVIFITAGQRPAESFGATSASRWHCGYENSALSGLLGNKYDNHYFFSILFFILIAFHLCMSQA